MLCALAGAALAAEPPPRPDDSPQRIEVAVGETVEREVGYAIGLRCDDTAVVRAELRPATPEFNVFIATGVTEGTATCRVGTSPVRPSYLFEIHVVPRRRQ
jgi:hypothetical protein